MSLRIMSVSDGYGPAVSLGVTEHEALVDVVGDVVVVVVDVLGLVGVSAHPTATAALAAPNTPSACRRVTEGGSVLRSLFDMSCVRSFCAHRSRRPASRRADVLGREPEHAPRKPHDCGGRRRDFFETRARQCKPGARPLSAVRTVEATEAVIDP